MANIDGTAGDDYLTGTAASDVINGNGGQDTLSDDKGGADRLDGGSGNDSLYIFRSANMAVTNSELIGGDGDDQLQYIAGNYAGLITIDAGNGNDRVWIRASAAGSAAVSLGQGQDILELDQSHNTMTFGNFGTTVTDFEVGDVGDRIEWTNFLSSYLQNWNGTNPFNTGHMRLVQQGSDVLLQSDRDAGGSAFGFVTLVTFNNIQSTSLTAFNLDLPLNTTPGVIDGTAGDDYLTGTAASDVINGNGGQDTLSDDKGGADRLDGGSGNDSLYIFRSANMAVTNSELIGGDGDDQLQYIAGNYAGLITIDAGNGNDRVWIRASAAGSAAVSLGQGQDILELDQSHNTMTFGNFGTTVTDFEVGDVGDRIEWTNFLSSYLQNWNGTNPFNTGHMRLVQQGSDVLLQSDRDAGGSAFGFVTLVTFNNIQSTSLTAFNLDLPLNTTPGVIDGTAGDDYLTGTAASDVINGNGGQDTLSDDKGGADRLDGGSGNDSLYIFRSANMAVTNSELIGGDGDDQLQYIAGNYAGLITIDAGNGNDRVWIRASAAGSAAVSLGQGQDILELDQSHNTMTFGNFGTTVTDFEVGDVGDRIEWTNFLSSYLQNWNGTNPFNTGHMRLVQQGSDVLLQSDRDAGGSAFGFVTLVTFNNIQSTSLTAFNLDLPSIQFRARNDFNGDGRSDLLLRDVNGMMAEWNGQADGSFVGNATVNYPLGPAWHIAGTGDFNGDGRSDLLLRNDNGMMAEWNGQTNGSFVGNATVNYLLDPAWHVAGTGDFNGDGRSDLLLRNDNGMMAEWNGQTNGSFVGNATVNYLLDPTWHVAGIGDFNGDGRSDLLLRNDNGMMAEWNGQTNGSFVGNATVNYLLDPAWHVAGIGDFNGDGRSDLLLRNDNGMMAEWSGQTNGSFVGNATVNYLLDPAWHVAGIGDFNGDGRSDLLLRNDNGMMAEWNGQANGGFVGNANVNYPLSTSWHLQDPFV